MRFVRNNGEWIFVDYSRRYRTLPPTVIIDYWLFCTFGRHSVSILLSIQGTSSLTKPFRDTEVIYQLNRDLTSSVRTNMTGRRRRAWAIPRIPEKKVNIEENFSCVYDIFMYHSFFFRQKQESKYAPTKMTVFQKTATTYARTKISGTIPERQFIRSWISPLTTGYCSPWNSQHCYHLSLSRDCEIACENTYLSLPSKFRKRTDQWVYSFPTGAPAIPLPAGCRVVAVCSAGLAHCRRTEVFLFPLVWMNYNMFQRKAKLRLFDILPIDEANQF